MMNLPHHSPPEEAVFPDLEDMAYVPVLRDNLINVALRIQPGGKNETMPDKSKKVTFLKKLEEALVEEGLATRFMHASVSGSLSTKNTNLIIPPARIFGSAQDMVAKVAEILEKALPSRIRLSNEDLWPSPVSSSALPRLREMNAKQLHGCAFYLKHATYSEDSASCMGAFRHVVKGIEDDPLALVYKTGPEGRSAWFGIVFPYDTKPCPNQFIKLKKSLLYSFITAPGYRIPTRQSVHQFCFSTLDGMAECQPA